ncbi:hypothetical protein C4573_02515 [Candidatus Woesearchaeota archaeon]|nr:MAG: hypothetical protein C4573_02515 [Candidatus Woesearchaeota archaeon]
MDPAYQSLADAVLSEDYVTNGFRGFDGLTVNRFLKTFGLPKDEAYGATPSPMVISFDYIVQKETRKPVLLELESYPGSILKHIAIRDAGFDFGTVSGGFNNFVSLDTLMQTWSSFDNVPVPFAHHLTVIADEKRLTHDLFSDYMPQLVNPETLPSDTLVVGKKSYGAAGTTVHILSAKEHLENPKNRSVKGQPRNNYFYEAFIEPEPFRCNGQEYAGIYRSVFFVGMKNGIPTLVPLATYARVSSFPINRDDPDTTLKVNVASTRNPAVQKPVSDAMADVLEAHSKKLFSEIVGRAKGTFAMSDLLQKPYVFNLSNVRGGQGGSPDQTDERNAVLDREFDGWAMYEPQWWGFDDGMGILRMSHYDFLGDISLKTYKKMILLQQPEIAIISKRLPIYVYDAMEGMSTLHYGARLHPWVLSWQEGCIPRKRMITLSSLTPEKLEQKIKEAKSTL